MAEDVELKISKLILAECDLQEYCNSMKNQLALVKMNYWQLYCTLDSNLKGFITADDVVKFFKGEGVELNLNESIVFVSKFGIGEFIDFNYFLKFTLSSPLFNDCDIELIEMLQDCYKKKLKSKACVLFEKEHREKQAKLFGVVLEVPQKELGEEVQTKSNSMIEMKQPLTDLAYFLFTISNIKSDLFNQLDFDLYSAFTVFDTSFNNVITKGEFRDGLRNLDILVSNSLADGLFSRLDYNNQGLLRISDFNKLFNSGSTNGYVFKLMSERRNLEVEKSPILTVIF